MCLERWLEPYYEGRGSVLCSYILIGSSCLEICAKKSSEVILKSWCLPWAPEDELKMCAIGIYLYIG